MRTSTAFVALFVLASISQLSAQDGRTNPGSSTSPSTSRPAGAGEKIPPHQQPKAGDVTAAGNGNTNYIDQLSAEDKALDRKLKNAHIGHDRQRAEERHSSRAAERRLMFRYVSSPLSC